MTCPVCRQLRPALPSATRGPILTCAHPLLLLLQIRYSLALGDRYLAHLVWEKQRGQSERVIGMAGERGEDKRRWVRV